MFLWCFCSSRSSTFFFFKSFIFVTPILCADALFRFFPCLFSCNHFFFINFILSFSFSFHGQSCCFDFVTLSSFCPQNSIIMKIFVLEVDSHLVPFYCPFTILHQTNASVIVWKLQQCSVMSLEKKHTKHIKHMHDIISEVKTPKKHTKHIKHMCQWLSGSCYSILSIEEEKKHIKHVKHMHGIISEVWNKKKHTKHTKHIGHCLSGFGNIALSCLLKKNT